MSDSDRTPTTAGWLSSEVPDRVLRWLKLGISEGVISIADARALTPGVEWVGVKRPDPVPGGIDRVENWLRVMRDLKARVS